MSFTLAGKMRHVVVTLAGKMRHVVVTLAGKMRHVVVTLVGKKCVKWSSLWREKMAPRLYWGQCYDFHTFST
jgi:hypothetical protein